MWFVHGTLPPRVRSYHHEAGWGLTQGCQKTTGLDASALRQVIGCDATLPRRLRVEMSVASGLQVLGGKFADDLLSVVRATNPLPVTPYDLTALFRAAWDESEPG